MSKYNKDDVKNMEYEDLIKLVSKLTPNEIIELSNEVGYPVFIRLCMGELKHKFVLLQDGTDRDKWGLPGGCQELGERFEETVIREIKEETNLDVNEENLKLIAIVSGNSRRNEYPNGDVVINNTALYCINNYSGELKWDSESKEMKFFDLDNLPQSQNDPDLIKIYKKYINLK